MAVTFPKLTESEVHTRLVDKSVKEIIEISADNIDRKNRCHDQIQLLDQGCFNPQDYFFISKGNNQQETLDWVKQNDYALHGYASEDHFEMQPEDGFTSAKKVCTFFLKKGAVASDAVHHMKKGLTIFGCGETVQLSQYLAIEDVLTPGKFNALFSADSNTPLIIGSRSSDNPLSRLRNYMKEFADPESPIIKKGDHIFYRNAKLYLDKHPLGSSQGYNLLCIDDTVGSQKFTTLGIPANGYTHGQMQTHCIGRFNLPIESLEFLSEQTKNELCEKWGKEDLELQNSFADRQITLEEFKTEKQMGGVMCILDELDTKRITALANATILEARKLMDSYDVRHGTRQVFSS